MTTLSRFGCAALALGGALLPGETVAQQNMDDVQIVAHHVAGNYYYLEGRGGNIGLSVGEDGVVMIDDQFAPLTDRIVAAIREISDGEIRLLINTHVHGDQIGRDGQAYGQVPVEAHADHRTGGKRDVPPFR